ncbi:DEAD/DEAH box helicase [Nocardia sp. NPDC006044]|uniref:DEAD/DEAH box helicase n=1 Tax=Nocardia sp. NPDC006044 TaxID=3364306 RepID=UPI0036963D0C
MTTPVVSSPASTTSFAALGVGAKLVGALTASGITAPFPIQSATLPDTLAGRDVLARGKTGSGKTLAFSIPMVDRLAGGDRRPGRRPRGLILAPTRELATQIAAALEPMATAAGLAVTTIMGGVSQHRQAKAFSAGVDIVVACPGRLEDLMRQRVVSLQDVQITVLDEADHMADLGFLPAVTRILAATPSGGQRLLFSATLDNGVNKLVKQFMRNPATHSVDTADSPVAAMTHHVFEVGGAEAKRVLVETLAAGSGRRILFMRTKHQARKLAKQLTTAGIPATDLHGNLSQVARDRNLAAFSNGTARVLVATDIAARGVHVDDVELVVHVDPPAEHKAYLHRSGRTARAGSAGDVVTVVLPEQRRDVAALLRKANITVASQRVTADSAPVTALVGTLAPRVAPSAIPVPSNDSQGNRNRRGGGDRRYGAPAGQSRSRGERGPRDGATSGGQPRTRTARDTDDASRGAAGRPRRGGRGTGDVAGGQPRNRNGHGANGSAAHNFDAAGRTATRSARGGAPRTRATREQAPAARAGRS